jgi:hypothetical protein
MVHFLADNSWHHINCAFRTGAVSDGDRPSLGLCEGPEMLTNLRALASTFRLFNPLFTSVAYVLFSGFCGSLDHSNR